MSSRCMSEEDVELDDNGPEGACAIASARCGPRHAWAPGNMEVTVGKQQTATLVDQSKDRVDGDITRSYLAPSMNAALLSAAYFLIVAVTSASDKPVARA